MPIDNASAGDAAAILVEAGFETLTDEMVGRLAQAASQGLDVLDELQRHRVLEILPLVGEFAASGDLARLVRLARLVGAAEDALTDDLVTRLAGLASHAMTVVDHVTRADDGRYARIWERVDERLTPTLVDRALKALPALLDLFERVTASGVLADCVEGFERLQGDLANAPRPGGGLGGLWALFKDADNQRVLQALLLYARHALKIDGASARTTGSR